MELERKLRKEEFTLEDFRDQIAADPQDGGRWTSLMDMLAESRAAFRNLPKMRRWTRRNTEAGRSDHQLR